METRLPMLNGYSRLEYQNMTGEDAFSMGVFQKDQLEDDVETETPLYAMPGAVQEMIYHAQRWRVQKMKNIPKPVIF